VPSPKIASVDKTSPKLSPPPPTKEPNEKHGVATTGEEEEDESSDFSFSGNDDGNLNTGIPII
jgi:hypothetical protein